MENLKFRIWDEDNEGFDFIDLFEIEKTIETLDSIRDYFHSDYLKTNNSFIQKHTGLNDKNGVGIYEGDILWSEPDIHQQVYFADGGFAIPNPSTREAQYLYSRNLDMYEVVGNIHENPELLK